MWNLLSHQFQICNLNQESILESNHNNITQQIVCLVYDFEYFCEILQIWNIDANSFIDHKFIVIRFDDIDIKFMYLQNNEFYVKGHFYNYSHIILFCTKYNYRYPYESKGLFAWIYSKKIEHIDNYNNMISKRNRMKSMLISYFQTTRYGYPSISSLYEMNVDNKGNISIRRIIYY